MSLHMHIQMIRMFKLAVTNVAKVSFNTAPASRISIAFIPLVVAVVITTNPSSALTTFALHRLYSGINKKVVEVLLSDGSDYFV